MKNPIGQWLCDKVEIKKHIVEFFTELYTNDKDEYIPYPIISAFPELEIRSMEVLRQAVNDMEIKNIIFSIFPIKVPSIDGAFHAIFF